MDFTEKISPAFRNMNESQLIQAQGIREQQEFCMSEYGVSKSNYSITPVYNQTLDQLFCPPFFDGFLCWAQSPANTLNVKQCPHYVAGFFKEFNASRLCTDSGEWFRHPEHKSLWTNYSQCYTNNPTVSWNFSDSNFTLPSNYVGIINAINTISNTGYTISFCALLIAFVIMLSIKKLHCPRNKLHMHLFASFILKIFFTMLKSILFVEGVGLRGNVVHKNGENYFYLDRNTNNWTCKFVVSLWEFFIIANHSWILMEGLYLHNLIFRALFADSNRNIINYIVLGWILPILVIIPWIVTRLLYDDSFCWTTHNEKLIFLIIRIPIMISVLINFVLFIRITMVIYSKLQAPIYEEARRYQKWARSTLVLVPLFGIHYAIFMGMSYAIDQNPTVELIWLGCDQFFASFQGLFVAILFCFLNAEVRTELKPHVHSFLTAWATHEYLRFVFPCRSKYLRSDKGRPSVCTTMSCSSLYNNGIGAHRNSKSKWEIIKAKHGSVQEIFLTTDRGKEHVCRSNVRSWHEVPTRWLQTGNGISKAAEVDFCANGEFTDEKSICLMMSAGEKSKSEPHSINETSHMLRENTKI